MEALYIFFHQICQMTHMVMQNYFDPKYNDKGKSKAIPVTGRGG
jgi:hypothetical protein